MAITTIQRLNPERDVAINSGKINYNESYDKYPLLLPDQPERLSEKTRKGSDSPNSMET